MERISGVAQVTLIGGSEREIQVNLNEERMAAYALSILDISNVLINSNLDSPTGKIKKATIDKRKFVYRGNMTALLILKNVIVKYMPDGTAVK